MKFFYNLRTTALGLVLALLGMSLSAMAAPTKLRTADCGNTCANLTYGLVADAVVGATQYEFELRNAGDNSFFASKIQTSRTLVLGNVSPTPVYGASYIVLVRAQVAGDFGSFGAPCTIALISDPNTLAPPPTKLRNADCNSTVLKCGFLLADPVSCATKYEFEISDNGGIYATKLQTTNQLAVWGLFPQLVWTQSYQVRVRAYRGSVAGPYGAVCNILVAPDPGNPGVPNVSIQGNQQNSSLPISGTLFTNTPTISQNRWAAITRNDFDFDFNGSTHATYVSNTNRCPLSAVSPALIPGNTYQVRVRAWVCNDHIGAYSPFTNITILSGNRYILSDDDGNAELLDENEAAPLEIETAIMDLQTAIFPQPARDNATLYLYDLEANESYNVQVIDLNGRVVANFPNQSSTSFNFPVESFEAGVYFVEVKTNTGKSQRNKMMIAK
jgi:hypothetical protein